MGSLSLEVASLIKNKRDKEALDLMRSQSERKYEETFPGFITFMLKEKGLKRKDVAIAAGLSPDYMYKVLRGDKKTNNRDYIIAYCIAAKFTLSELDKALSLYPITPLLEEGRDLVIRSAIMAEATLDKVNQLLEKSGYDPIDMGEIDKFSNKKNIGPKGSICNDKTSVTSNCNEAKGPQIRRGFMKELDCKVWYEMVMCAPVDYNYLGESKIELDDGSIVYASVMFGPMGNQFGVSKKSLKDLDFKFENYTEVYYWDAFGYASFLREGEEGANVAELNALLLKESMKSEFFPYFTKLNYLTDRLIAEDDSINEYFWDRKAELEKAASNQ